MKLFEERDGVLVLLKTELYNNVAFKKLIERDRGSEKDNDGRKKFRTTKECRYIFCVADLTSFGNLAKYNEKELHEYGIREAQLEEKFKPDTVIKDCISEYRRIQLEIAPTLEFLHTATKGLKNATKVIENINESIEGLLELINKSSKAAIEKGESANVLESLAFTKSLTDQLEQVMDICNKAPKMIKVLEELEDKVKKEQTKEQVIRGGGVKGNRQDPK